MSLSLLSLLYKFDESFEIFSYSKHFKKYIHLVVLIKLISLIAESFLLFVSLFNTYCKFSTVCVYKCCCGNGQRL